MEVVHQMSFREKYGESKYVFFGYFSVQFLLAQPCRGSLR